MDISRRSFLGLAAAAAATTLGACGSSSENEQASQDQGSSSETKSSLAADPVGTHHATIKVKDKGTIKVELLGDQAPITVQNFMDLANEKFYDGLTFHRIIKGFMIQGGDPNGDGTGGSGKNIKGEFYSNGVTNVIPHQRGVISMARSNDPDSASSQFFIVHEDSMDSLDGQYAAFGRVTEGMEVVDDIAENTPVTDNNGTVEKANQPIIESITIDD